MFTNRKAILLLSLIAIGCSDPSDPNIERAKAIISHDLNDPVSAQFREIQSSDRCVTGQVNAKNLAGGYIGFQDFFVNLKAGTGLIKPADALSTVGTSSFSTALKEEDDYGHGLQSCL